MSNGKGGVKIEQVPYFEHEEIAIGCYMIRSAFVEQTLLCYLIDGGDYALLIDTMMGWGDLLGYCKKLTSKPIKLVNTHAHPDHVLGNLQFGSCYMHHRDIAAFWQFTGFSKEMLFAAAKQSAMPEYRDKIKLDGNFTGTAPMPVIPIYGGDIFDLGDREVEVVEAGGHTPGSVILIDHNTRIAYSGDACNGNTLLELPDSLTVEEYMDTLLRLKERQPEFDIMYGGHEVFDASVIDEAVETVGRVLDGTDDKCKRQGMMGKTVFYAAEKVEGGYERADGKHFNMSYLPEKIRRGEDEDRVIK